MNTLVAARGQTDRHMNTGNDAFQSERLRMVREQLADIDDARVITAMNLVPRHEFVPPEIRQRAYEDCALPIGFGQTISQPFIVAFMSAQLHLDPSDRVLEIGTGCGYQAAVLSRLVSTVHTIEIIEPLARRAMENLKRIGCENVSVHIGDGSQGWPGGETFERIIVTCAPTRLPRPLLEQLEDGGRMIAPIGHAEEEQQLILLQRFGHEVRESAILPVRFVPMTGQTRTR